MYVICQYKIYLKEDNTMARKTKEEAQNTRKKILDAALDVFYVKGVGQTSLEDIAESAGVTRGAVYWHFKNKTDIFNALHTEIHMSFIDRSIDTQARTTLSPLDQLSSLCIDSLEDIETDMSKRKFFTVFFLKCDYSGDLAGLLSIQNAQKAESLKVTRVFFERALAKGQLPENSNVDVLAASLYCYIGGIIHEYLRDPDFIHLKTMARPMVEIYFKKLI